MALRTPIKAIRAKCLDCCCGSSNEVRACPVENCPLFEYRFGRRPKPEGSYTPEDEDQKNAGLRGGLSEKPKGGVT